MAGQYKVDFSELSSGAGTVQGLSSQAESIAKDLATTLSGLANAAGDQGLTMALANVDEVCAQRMLDITALFGHISQSLGESARTYEKTETDNQQRITNAGGHAK